MKRFARKLIFPVTIAVSVACGIKANAFDWQSLLSGGMKVLQSMSVSDQEIMSYVSQAVTQLDKQNTVLPANNPYSVRLRKLTQGLTEVNGIPLTFKVYKVNEINAFACADGNVRVYTGLMDLMNDEEVLGVIGHEIGHVAHKDTKNLFKKALLTAAARDGLTSLGGTIGKLSRSSLGDLSETLIGAKHSRKAEEKADDYGYSFLKKNGKNPWAMAMAFEKMLQLEGSGRQGAWMEMFSDHPSTVKRIERMSKKAQKDGFSRTTSTASNSSSSRATSSTSSSRQSASSASSSSSSYNAPTNGFSSGSNRQSTPRRTKKTTKRARR